MKQITSSADAETALGFLESVVDRRSALGEKMLAFARDQARDALTSRSFGSQEEIGWGNGEGRFSNELTEIASHNKNEKAFGSLMIWDNGYAVDDVQTEALDLYCKEYFPDLVVRVKEEDGVLNIENISDALRTCLSFNPVAFFETRGAVHLTRGVAGVVLCAFDQEGALAWL